MRQKYYQMAVNDETKTAEIYIYGDITSWEWLESDVSSYTLAKELQSLPEDISSINVYINSYGGNVSEGLAIYNALKRHKAKVTTYCDGFAASIASVIFMAGDERVMSSASLLFIHNAWTYTYGNANELKKAAEDLEKITQASINAYMEYINISEDELKEKMDAESWLSPSECMEWGFCTRIESEKNSNNASQSVKKAMMQKLLAKEVISIPDPKEPEPTEPKETENFMLKFLQSL